MPHLLWGPLLHRFVGKLIKDPGLTEKTWRPTPPQPQSTNIMNHQQYCHQLI